MKQIIIHWHQSIRQKDIKIPGISYQIEVITPDSANSSLELTFLTGELTGFPQAPRQSLSMGQACVMRSFCPSEEQCLRKPGALGQLQLLKFLSGAQSTFIEIQKKKATNVRNGILNSLTRKISGDSLGWCKCLYMVTQCSSFMASREHQEYI